MAKSVDPAADLELARIKRDISRDVRKAMQRKRTSQAALSRQMRASRRTLQRMLNAEEASLTLRFLARVVMTVDARLTLALVERKGRHG